MDTLEKPNKLRKVWRNAKGLLQGNILVVLNKILKIFHDFEGSHEERGYLIRERNGTC